MNLPKTTELFDLSHSAAGIFLSQFEYPYLALPKIKEFIASLAEILPKNEYYEHSDGVIIANDAKIDKSATLLPPTIVGHCCEVRPGAFIRGSALIGNGAVIGNSTEIKNAIIFDEVQLPHYNYVGDSILGYRSHLGAGAIISNFKLDHSNINITSNGEKLDTELRKFGAVVGDFSEIGCNSVVFPGSIIGKHCLIYPLSSVRGIIKDYSIVHTGSNITYRRTD